MVDQSVKVIEVNIPGIAGPAGIGLTGAYNPARIYVLNETCLYGGSSFAARRQVSGIAPSLDANGFPMETADWRVVVSRGSDGWAPVLVAVRDGRRQVFRVLDWTGGTGVKPSTGFVSAGGIVATAAQADDFLKAQPKVLSFDDFGGMPGAWRPTDTGNAGTNAANAAFNTAMMDANDAAMLAICAEAKALGGADIWFSPQPYHGRVPLEREVPIGTYGAGPRGFNRGNANFGAPLFSYTWHGNGAAYRSVMTRQTYRGSAGDPEDAPINASDIWQAPGCHMDASCTWQLAEDATNWDCGIFVGYRSSSSIEGSVLGAWAVGNVVIDCTGSALLSPPRSWRGHRYTVQQGGDGFWGAHGSWRGGRHGLVTLGVKLKPGLSAFGFQLTNYLTVTLTAQPAEGDTLTLGGQAFTFSFDGILGTALVPFGETKEATAANLLEGIIGLIDAGVGLSLPAFGSGLYSLNGAQILCVNRWIGDEDEVKAGLFNTTFTASETSAAITLSAGIPTVQADPGRYYDEVLGLVQDTRCYAGNSDYHFHDLDLRCYSDKTQAFGMAREDTNHELETCPCPVRIDARCANGAGAVQGWVLSASRLHSSYPVGIWLGSINNLRIRDCHFDFNLAPSVRKPNGDVAFHYGAMTKIRGRSRCVSVSGVTQDANRLFWDFDQGSSYQCIKNGQYTYGGSFNMRGPFSIGRRYFSTETPTVTRWEGLTFYIGETSGGATLNFRGNYDNLYRGRLQYTVADRAFLFRIQKVTGNNASTVLRMTYTPGADTVTINSDVGVDGGLIVQADTGTMQVKSLLGEAHLNGVASRLLASGVSAVRCNGTAVDVYHTLQYAVDASLAIGQASKRATTIHLVNSPTVTSDGSHKQDFSDQVIDGMTMDRVLDAWGQMRIGAFRWIDAVRDKGDAARWHFSVIAQEMRDTFIHHGVDGQRLGVLTWDGWAEATETYDGEPVETWVDVAPDVLEPDQVATDLNAMLEAMADPDVRLDADGRVIAVRRMIAPQLTRIIPAGEIWGVRPEQAFWIEALWTRRELTRLQSRLDALERRA